MIRRHDNLQCGRSPPLFNRRTTSPGRISVVVGSPNPITPRTRWTVWTTDAIDVPVSSLSLQPFAFSLQPFKHSRQLHRRIRAPTAPRQPRNVKPPMHVCQFRNPKEPLPHPHLCQLPTAFCLFPHPVHIVHPATRGPVRQPAPTRTTALQRHYKQANPLDSPPILGYKTLEVSKSVPTTPQTSPNPCV